MAAWLSDDFSEASGGEKVDALAHEAISLAHQVLERFPEMKRKHMFIASGAAVSSAVIIAAGVAVARRIRAGRSVEQAVNEVTEEELEGLRLVPRAKKARFGRNHDVRPTGSDN
ncbi:MAG: hypothetical protein EXR68_04910 [Dehalococcoidia bacterium]|nr:hypothetical protein [Dehalococcoidia bacterium]